MRTLPLIILFAAAPAAADSVVTAPVSFSVTNPLEPLVPRTVRGAIYLPASAPRCDRTVVLLLHGLSYGAWAWDFPIETSTYSMARALASRGFAAVAIDELGYGASDHPNDVLFPPQMLELLLFTAALDKSFYLVPGAGHSFMLHPNAPQSQQVVTSWLSARLPSCPVP